jgi:gamma-glutamyltranspeptidase/glutathione hydrolase
MRRAFVDRNRYLGDPDFVAMPLDRLLSREYAAALRRGIVVGRATPTSSLALAPVESSDTTHYSVVDALGNAVALTTTLNGSFGSMVTVTGAGFLLNNEMDDFAAKPGAPNLYGLVQGEANAIAPGKRMLSSMTPSLVVDRRGRLELVLGSPGGPTIITTVFQVISNVLDHGMSPAAAVEAPRIHHQALPDRIFYEPDGLALKTRERLEGMGYELEERKETSGSVSAIARRGGRFIGVADPRRGGGAASPEGL